MRTQTERLLSNSWDLVRDAGSSLTDAAAQSRVGTQLVRSLPRVKEMVSVGAGLALARRGTRIAAGAVRRHPLAAIAGAVALAGVGLALSVAKRRKANGEARDNSAEARTGTRRLTAQKVDRDHRGSARKSAATKAGASTATRKPRARKAASKSTPTT